MVSPSPVLCPLLAHAKLLSTIVDHAHPEVKDDCNKWGDWVL